MKYVKSVLPDADISVISRRTGKGGEPFWFVNNDEEPDIVLVVVKMLVQDDGTMRR